jgi:hypothetical protein
MMFVCGHTFSASLDYLQIHPLASLDTSPYTLPAVRNPFNPESVLHTQSPLSVRGFIRYKNKGRVQLSVDGHASPWLAVGDQMNEYTILSITDDEVVLVRGANDQQHVSLTPCFRQVIG